MKMRLFIVFTIALLYSCCKEEELCKRDTGAIIGIDPCFWRGDDSGNRYPGFVIETNINGKKDTVLTYSLNVAHLPIPESELKYVGSHYFDQETRDKLKINLTFQIIDQTDERYFAPVCNAMLPVLLPSRLYQLHLCELSFVE